MPVGRRNLRREDGGQGQNAAGLMNTPLLTRMDDF